MKVVWAVDFPAFEEGYLVNWLFPHDVEIRHLQEGESSFSPDLLVVASEGRRLTDHSQEAVLMWPKAAVYVLSDETGVHSFAPYRQCRVVLRNYAKPGWGSGRAFVFPLGFNQAFLGSPSSIASRPLTWSFAGQIKGDRSSMLSLLSRISEHKIVETTSFGGSTGLDGSALRSMYEMSHFVPCPWGNVSPDSFRIMEALQAGAVPLVLDFYGIDYFKMTFGNHPFVSGSSWKDVALKLDRYCEDEKLLQGLHDDVNDWYSRFSSRLRSDFLVLVENGPSARVLGKQFTYQKRSRHNPLVRLVFWWHYSRPAKTAWKWIRKIPDRLIIGLGMGRLVRKR